MLMRALAFYNEFVSYTDVEKLFACPVDPSTDLSIDIEQFYRADKAPKTVQEQENRQALLRVTLALLHEPLRLYKETSAEVPSLRVPELHEFVHSASKFRNLSTTLRHRRFLFTDSFLLLWKWRVG